MAIRKKPNWKAPRIGAAELALLETLSNASGVSGNEAAIRRIVQEEINGLADDVVVDAVGNLLVTKKGRGQNLPRVMLAAHMDEVGFMITGDDGDGIFRIETVGGVDERTLAGKPVWVGEKRQPGVIGAKPVHLTTASERSSALTLDALRIDLGPASAKKARVGDWATFATEFTRVGPSLRGKALDDRLGVTTLITLLKHAPANIDLLAAFTVQEEIGLRGARVAGYAMKPDIAIALDCTPAMDLPRWDGSENTQYRSKLDGGPAIYVADGSTLADPRLVTHLQAVGDAYGIPYQLRQPGSGGTDAGAIHKTRDGVPSISVSVPARYLHTPAAIARLDDWKNSLALLHAALTHIDRDLLKGAR
ncbi:MAG: M42 family peptidase [Anaerolineae bacterium]|nr:MAG: M42 family peptidase [Anaerolineae bacterium]